MTTRLTTLTTVSAVLVDDEEGLHVDITAYVQDGHVVLAFADAGEEHPEVAEVDPLLILTPHCAEVWARDVLAACARARGEGVERPMGDA